jgi:beta-RFAP synthase
MGVQNIEVNITAPSRLHFGIIDMRGDLGRIHGSVGVAIDYPNLCLKAIKSDTLKVRGSRVERVSEFARIIMREYCNQEAVEIEVLSDIPEHMGFGSGTQLALSVGEVFSRLYNLHLTTTDIATLLGRSKVSGIGTHAFQHGGFIVDGGHKLSDSDSVPPLVFRTDVPDDWYFVIGIPEINIGHSGLKEQNAFKELEPPPARLVAEVSRIVLIKMIPAILEREVEAFGEAMTSLDAKFGDYWALVQGGRYSNKRIEHCVNYLLNEGAYGAGQSSWGPALYALAEGKSHANDLLESLNTFFDSKEEKGRAFVTQANNRGANVVIKD